MDTDSSALSWAIPVLLLFLFFLAALLKASVASFRQDQFRALHAPQTRGSEALESLHAEPTGPTGALSALTYLLFGLSLLGMASAAATRDDSTAGAVALASIGSILAAIVLYVVARALASRLGETFAIRVAPFALSLARVIAPILAAESWLTSRFLGGVDAAEPSDPSPAELGVSIEAAGEPLDEHEIRMIRGVVQLDRTTAREIMVPRVDMVAAELGTSLRELAADMVRSGHSRVPIYQDNLDDIRGIAYARDVLGRLSSDPGATGQLTDTVIRSPLYIPESKTLEELLREFQEQRVNVAIVIDEYGGVSGLVTIEDLLEEIVGEINDEFDVAGPEVEPVDANEFLMDARVGIDRLYELLDVKVEGDGFDTIGGFVYQRLGKIPSAGDVVEYDGIRIEVVSTVGRRLKRLRVVRTPPAPEDTNHQDAE